MPVKAPCPWHPRGGTTPRRCLPSCLPWGAGGSPGPPGHWAQGGTQGRGCSWCRLSACCGAGAPVTRRGEQGGRGFSHAAGSPRQLAAEDAGSAGCGAEQQLLPRDVREHQAAKPVDIPLPAGPSPLAAPCHRAEQPRPCPGMDVDGSAGGREVLGAVDLCLCSTSSPSDGERQNRGT